MSIPKSRQKFIWIGVAIIILVLIAYLVYSKLFADHRGARPGGPAIVKVVTVISKDVPLNLSYAGNIRAVDEVKIMPKVSGAIVEKYVVGGQYVHRGQALYRIDNRQYESALLAAQANLDQARASYQEAVARLDNAELDNQRYQKLLAQDAISDQQATTQQSQVNALRAAVSAQQAIVESNVAMVQRAQQNLHDTIVYAPTSGKVSLDLVDVGTFANAGNTVLTTLGSTQKVYVQFNVSETEYNQISSLVGKSSNNVTIILSDGKEYPLRGSLVQVDSQLSQNTGSLAINALFNNPQDTLVPGMFARVTVAAGTIPHAILIPQRAVQQVLEKSFVMTVGPDGKSLPKPVELGQKVGSYWIVKSGLNVGDKVVVDGLTKLQPGVPLKVEMTTPEQLGLTL